MPQTPCLFAPADDRNAPATPTAGWRRQLPAVQFNRSRMAQHVRMHLEADLGRDVGALDQPIWPRFQCPQRPQVHPRAVGKLPRVTICRELRHSAQIIKSEHSGTDRAGPTQSDVMVATVPLLMAHTIMGHTLLTGGDFNKAREDVVTRGLRFTILVNIGRWRRGLAKTLGCECFPYRSLTLWFLGFPGAALKDAEDVVKYARERRVKPLP